MVKGKVRKLRLAVMGREKKSLEPKKGSTDLATCLKQTNKIKDLHSCTSIA